MNPDPLLPRISRQPFSEMYPKKPLPQQGPMVLLILDGWGIGPDYPGNAVIKARTPNMDRYWVEYPHTQLTASGEAVGLPDGVDGNSETGHMNIGAGGIVFQDLPRINASIADSSFMKNQAFVNAINHAKHHDSTLHLMGLLGGGFVHSSLEHLFALLNTCKLHGLNRVLIHGFTDGRDSPPTAAANYVRRVMEKCKEVGIGEIATLTGRYYAMDRDKKWDRIERAYNALTMGTGACTQDAFGALQQQYNAGVTDEYIEPIIICDTNDQPHRL